MATTENEYYLRSILLLADGGSYISKKVLYRELSGDLDTLLKNFKSKLKNELHEKQMEKLFPSHGNTFVDTWDLQMLIIVVLRLFHASLKQEDKRNLRVIKMLRHEVQAHNPGPTLDDVQYDNIKDQLTDALTSLASGFDEDVQKECRSYITKYASGPLDVMSARECLKQLQENDAMFKQVLEKVEKSNNDMRSCVNASTTVVSQRITDLEKILIERLEKLDMGICRKKIKGNLLDNLEDLLEVLNASKHNKNRLSLIETVYERLLNIPRASLAPTLAELTFIPMDQQIKQE